MKKLILYLTLTLFVFVGFKFVSASEVTGYLNPGLDTGITGVTRAAPILSPVAGTYTSAQTVSLTADSSTKICYTTNGTTPACATATTCTTGTALVNGGIVSIPSSMTIKSAACYADDSTGPVAISAYTINIPSGGGGGGGGSLITYCSSVTYAAWGTCVGGLQTRSVLTSTPSGCTLTTSQQLAAQQNCDATTPAGDNDIPPATPPTTTPPVNNGNVVSNADFVAREKALVKKVNQSLTNRLAGRILLQVQEKGQGWYVNPANGKKYFLGRANDAFNVMRYLSLGISNKDFASFKNNTAPARLSGRILLKVEDHGKAYYVNPLDLKMHYLGRPDDAYQLMRSLGLGITNDNIRQITVGEFAY